MQKIEECFAKQFEIDGLVDAVEITADSGALAVAFQALKRFSEVFSGNSQPLAKLSNFTAEQLFFVSAAFANCGPNNLYAPPRTHPRPIYRVNLGLANRPEFARAWKCRKGDPMFRAKPCMAFS